MEKEEPTTIVPFLVVSLFSMSSWMAVNGLWSELPLLVESLPEGWSLPSYLVIIVQAANVAPLGYLALKKLKPSLAKECPTVVSIIAVSSLASFLLAFTWSETTVVGTAAEPHSVALFALSFCFAAAECASPAVYLSYMARFRSPVFITAFYVGEGLSGFLPAFLGLVQIVGTGGGGGGIGGAAGDDGDSIHHNRSYFRNESSTDRPAPKFSVGVFFGILSALLAVSLVVFLLLHFHSFFDRFKDDLAGSRVDDKDRERISSGSHVPATENGAERYDQSKDDSLFSRPQIVPSTVSGCTGTSQTDDNNEIEPETKSHRTGFQRLIIIYVMIVWMNGLQFGLLTSIQSFSCLPYGSLTYDLAVKLSILSCPLASLLTLFLVIRKLPVIAIICLTGTLMTAYQFLLATQSPNPILEGQATGIVLCVASSVVASACFTFSKVCLSRQLLLSGPAGERLLLYCGLLMQLGSFLGAALGFLLVNVLRVFGDSS